MRWVGRVGLSLLLVAAVTYAAAWATTDRFGASRAIAWLGADTGDIHRFPSRPVPAGGDVLELPAGEPLDLAAVWPRPDDPEAFLERTGTAAFLVAQDGTLRYEGYFNGAAPEELRTSFSTAKSVVSTLIGLALDDGSIDALDDPVTAYVPELAERDPRFADITIRDLLSMSSGLRYVERSLPWSDDAQTYYGTDLGHGPVGEGGGAAGPDVPVQQLQPAARGSGARAGHRPHGVGLPVRTPVATAGRGGRRVVEPRLRGLSPASRSLPGPCGGGAAEPS